MAFAALRRGPRADNTFAYSVHCSRYFDLNNPPTFDDFARSKSGVVGQWNVFKASKCATVTATPGKVRQRPQYSPQYSAWGRLGTTSLAWPHRGCPRGLLRQAH